jgi:hypothetical protein
MSIPVIIEPLEGIGFQARTPFGWSAEGSTRDEALRRLQEMISRKVADTTTITSIDVPMPAHPLLKFAGTWKDNPLIGEWTQAVEEYRKQVEDDPERQL